MRRTTGLLAGLILSTPNYRPGGGREQRLLPGRGDAPGCAGMSPAPRPPRVAPRRFAREGDAGDEGQLPGTDGDAVFFFFFFLQRFPAEKPFSPSSTPGGVPLCPCSGRDAQKHSFRDWGGGGRRGLVPVALGTGGEDGSSSGERLPRPRGPFLPSPGGGVRRARRPGISPQPRRYLQRIFTGGGKSPVCPSLGLSQPQAGRVGCPAPRSHRNHLLPALQATLSGASRPARLPELGTRIDRPTETPHFVGVPPVRGTPGSPPHLGASKAARRGTGGTPHGQLRVPVG